ncbi:hypothetical protein L1889_03750 [Paenalcaligenes niemegkensis]|uniref:hypothetical protein n=1 Tax=Paenalcaligenes niemegkensis TaxID=2895469 RepID=UPI001EE8B024|nr:hypothetical protein [Paenalcaligenes niemegkensis]MCQ9615924.1 hypothetical protein [Paenalcaligenes niemegkensis]
MSRLLIDENPLQVLPDLAVAIGLNEAIVLQQIHYWLRKSNVVIDGERWVHNTVQQWQEQFPFWSADTVRRTLASLKKKGLLVAERHGKSRFDRTNYYRIDRAVLATFDDSNLQCSDDGILQCSDDCKLPCCYIDRDYPETTQRKGDDDSETDCKPDVPPFDIFWSAYPKKVAKQSAEKAFKKIKPNAELLQTILQSLARFKECRGWKKDGGEFIPNPATWLNGQRWNDELGDAGDSSDDPFEGAI